ncbi:hypothetical protein EDD86DRAFT_215546 [Gorgonomyces haynaldii]|nr:hypothetical protein EDD86DRAFT_215546 [Gorgonomyces haynaldii]
MLLLTKLASDSSHYKRPMFVIACAVLVLVAMETICLMNVIDWYVSPYIIGDGSQAAKDAWFAYYNQFAETAGKLADSLVLVVILLRVGTLFETSSVAYKATAGLTAVTIILYIADFVLGDMAYSSGFSYTLNPSFKSWLTVSAIAQLLGCILNTTAAVVFMQKTVAGLTTSGFALGKEVFLKYEGSRYCFVIGLNIYSLYCLFFRIGTLSNNAATLTGYHAAPWTALVELYCFLESYYGPTVFDSSKSKSQASQGKSITSGVSHSEHQQ